MRRNINKLILGTAQFDGSYGIKNTKKKPIIIIEF